MANEKMEQTINPSIIQHGLSRYYLGPCARESRGKVQVFSSFFNNVARALNIFVGGFMYEHFSPELPFYLAMGFIVPAFLLALIMVHEPEKEKNNLS